jgi:L-ribulose-5-phosphate 3-epimerase
MHDPAMQFQFDRRVGVCSWSLRSPDAVHLAASAARIGVARVQLALDPIRERRAGWGEIQTVHALHARGITIASGMMGTLGEDYSSRESIARTGGVRPDATWGANFRAAEQNARLARRLGLDLVTLHAGFIPHEGNAERETLIRRLRQIIDVFDDCGVRIAFETGQESADTLLFALESIDRPHVGVNFDAANMILYGMGDPVAALAKLGPRVVQVHIKDAVPATMAGTWGEEVRAGSGAVDWTRLFDTLHASGFAGGLIVEREAGESRLDDAIAGRNLVFEHLRRIATQGTKV